MAEKDNATFAGKAYTVTHQTPGTNIVGQTSFVATTPTFCLCQSSKTTRIIPKNLKLAQASAAGGVTKIVIAIDNTNRYVSGGTAIVPMNRYASWNGAIASGSNASFYYNPTVGAAGSGTRYVDTHDVAAAQGTVTNIDLSGLIIGGTGSLLIYTWAATTGPAWDITLDYSEELIQS